MSHAGQRRLCAAVFAAVVVAVSAGCGSNVSREEIREAAGLGPTGATAAAASSPTGTPPADSSVGAAPAESSTDTAPAAAGVAAGNAAPGSATGGGGTGR